MLIGYTRDAQKFRNISPHQNYMRQKSDMKLPIRAPQLLAAIIEISFLRGNCCQGFVNPWRGGWVYSDGDTPPGDHFSSHSDKVQYKILSVRRLIKSQRERIGHIKAMTPIL
jgi:hypothetical protein